VRERSGQWQVRWRGPDGTSGSATATTRKAALSLGKRGELGLPVDLPATLWQSSTRGALNVRGYSQEWLKVKMLVPVSYRSYSSMLRKHVLPRFGTRAIASITALDVRTFLRELDDAGVSGVVQRQIRAVGSSMWADAVDDGVVTSNPWRGARISAAPPREMRIITPDQYRALLDEIPAPYKLFVRVLAESGARFGEVIALEPGDLKGTILSLAKTMDERGYVKTGTKNRSNRRVAITAELAGVLHELTGALMFTTATGRPIRNTEFGRTIWKPAIRRAGLAGTRIHDLRHSHASWLLNGGADLAVVRDRLGHSNITVTSRYLHTLPGAGDQALAALDSMLHSSLSGRTRHEGPGRGCRRGRIQLRITGPCVVDRFSAASLSSTCSNGEESRGSM
jgi:integrase